MHIIMNLLGVVHVSSIFGSSVDNITLTSAFACDLPGIDVHACHNFEMRRSRDDWHELGYQRR